MALALKLSVVRFMRHYLFTFLPIFLVSLISGCTSVDSDDNGGRDALMTGVVTAIRAASNFDPSTAAVDVKDESCAAELSWSCGQMKTLSADDIASILLFLEENEALLAKVANSIVKWVPEVKVNGEVRACKAPLQSGPGTIECVRDQVKQMKESSPVEGADRLNALLYEEVAHLMNVSDDRARAMGILMAYHLGKLAAAMPSRTLPGMLPQDETP